MRMSLITALVFTGAYAVGSCQDRGLSTPQNLRLPDVLSTPRVEFVLQQSSASASSLVGKPIEASVIVTASGANAKGEKVAASGSGTSVWNGSGSTLILTCEHVMRKMVGPKIVVSWNGEEHTAEVVNQDEPNDVAILRIAAVIPSVEIDEKPPVIGDEVTSIGNSGGDGYLTEHRHRVTEVDKDSIFTDTQTIEGRSGGGLFKNGRLIGVIKGRVKASNESVFIRASVASSLIPTGDKMSFGASQARRLVRAYSLASCVNCKKYHDAFGDGDDRTAVEWTDDPLPDWIRKSLPRGYLAPVFVWTNGTKHQWPNSSNGVTLDLLAQWTEAFDADRETQAAPVGEMALSGQSVIADVLAQIENWAGDGATATFRMIRRDAKPALLIGQTNSRTDILGKSGRIEFVLTAAKKLPVHELKFNYRFATVNGKERPFIDFDEMMIDLPDSEEPGPVGASREYGSPVLIAYTVISTVTTIYAILHPTIDIWLGEELLITGKYEAGTLSIDMGPKPPSIRAHWSFWYGLLKAEYSRPLTGVVISAEKTVAEFHKSKLYRDVVIPGL